MREICRRSMAAMLPRCLPGLPRPRQLSYCLRRWSMPTRPSCDTGGPAATLFQLPSNIRLQRYSPRPPTASFSEEVILKEGKLRVEIEGEESKDVTAAGAVYVASNKMHAWTNAGDSTATYFVVEIGNDS